jgi:spore germination protein KC
MRWARWIHISLIIAVSCCSSGCWDQLDIEKLGIMMSMGIDHQTGDSGESLARVSMQIARPSSLQQRSGSKGQSGAIVRLAATAGSEFEAVRSVNNEFSRRILTSHCDMVVFGRAHAQAGVVSSLDLILRDHEMRPNMQVIVADPSAEALQAADIPMESIPALSIVEMLEHADATSQLRPTTVVQLANMLLNETHAATIPLMRQSGDQSQSSWSFVGTAVLSHGKMVGELDRRQTRGMLWLTDEVKSGALVSSAPDGAPVTFEPIRSKSQIRVALVNGQPTIHVTIRVVVSLAETETSGFEATESDLLDLDRRVSKAIIDEAQAAIDQAKALKADVFAFGETINRKYPRIWKQLAPNWETEFARLPIQIEVAPVIGMLGQITKSLKPQ